MSKSSQEEVVKRLLSIFIRILPFIVIAACLYLSRLYNYLLFHSLAEIFSIVIAATIFMIAWNTRTYTQSQYFLFLGIVYFFIGGFDLIHTLAFPGMQIFSYDYYAPQFWLASRYVESISFVIAFYFINKKKKVDVNLTFFIYLAIFALLTSSILWWKIFPNCYIEGVGQTNFKIISEYVIIAILLVAYHLLLKHKDYFDIKGHRLLRWSILITVVSEVSFTLYIGNYDFANMAGHFLKLVSYYFVYIAIIETGFSKPISLFFRELKQSEEELKNLNATKDKFFSIIAHDLKSPFNSLIGFSDLLINNYDVFSEEDRKKLIVLINSSSRKAHNLLDNLLNWSRTQSGMLETRPELFNIVDLIQESIGLLESSAKEKNIEIRFDREQNVNVIADKNMIGTVIRNLINNAIKFTPKEGTISIRVEMDDGNIKVSVADNGIGMSRDKLNKLFRIDEYISTAGTANEKGSGLGLIICKEFIEKNNGLIQVKSQPNHGSEFIFTLPKGDEKQVEKLADEIQSGR